MPCILVLCQCLLKVYFQVDRSLVVRREKELNAKVESADVARNSFDSAESRIEELELQLQKCITEKNDFEIKMEEANQDSGEIANLLSFFKKQSQWCIYLIVWFVKAFLAAGRKDIKAEFRVMASSLSKEMGMMEAQLKRWKETSHETLSLLDEAQSLKSLLSMKVWFYPIPFSLALL